MRAKIIRPEGKLEQAYKLRPKQKMHLVIYPASSSTLHWHCKLDKDAKLTIQYIATGGSNIAQFGFELEEGAELVFDGAFRLREKDSLNLNYKTVHLGANSKSRFSLVGTLDEEATKDSTATIDFKNGASGAVGSEREKVTLFSNQAKNIARPIILCNEENMHGTHNFSSGHLAPEAVDYLRARGIDLENVKRIISREQILSVAKLTKDEAIIKEIEGLL